VCSIRVVSVGVYVGVGLYQLIDGYVCFVGSKLLFYCVYYDKFGVCFMYEHVFGCYRLLVFVVM